MIIMFRLDLLLFSQIMFFKRSHFQKSCFFLNLFLYLQITFFQYLFLFSGIMPKCLISRGSNRPSYALLTRLVSNGETFLPADCNEVLNYDDIVQQQLVRLFAQTSLNGKSSQYLFCLSLISNLYLYLCLYL